MTHDPQQPRPEAQAFLMGASLSLDSAPRDAGGLHARIGTLLQEALPETLVLVASYDPAAGVLRPEAWAGPPGALAILERTLPADHQGDLRPCPDGTRARLLEAQLHPAPEGAAAPLRALASHPNATSCYELGLVHEEVLLGAVTLLSIRPLSAAEQRSIEALAQHAGIALAQERIEAVEETALLVGLDGRVQACSRQAVAQLAPAPEEQPLSPKDQLDLRRERLKALLTQGRAVRYTEQVDGRIRDCSLHPVVGDDGRVRAFAGFARDITQRVHLEERVRHAATFQRALFSSLSEGVLVLDAQGVITDCNRSLQRSLGMARSELVGRGGAEISAQRADWERWEHELLPQLEPGGDPVQLELRMRRKDGASFTAQVGASRIELAGSEQSVVWTVRDATDELLRFEQLEHMATHDDLTGLPNRVLFHDRLGRARETGRRYGTGFAVLMLDLDGFKAVNDTLGHEMGDRLLAALGVRLKDALRAADTVSRLGGDEFAVLLSHTIPADQAMAVADKLLGIIEQPFELDDHALRVSASIGVAMFPEHDGEGVELLARADHAMYAAKRRGGRQVLLVTDESEG